MEDRVWSSARAVNPDKIQEMILEASVAADKIRLASQFMSKVLDYIGAAERAISLFSTGSPTLGYLNTIAALFQSLIDDLLNQGAHVLLHYNFRDIIHEVGFYNLISEVARRDLHPVATNIESVEGANPEMMVDSQVEGQGTPGFGEFTPDTLAWAQMGGYELWIAEMIAAFTDTFDHRRPIVDTYGGVGGVVFLAGAGYIIELQPVIEALADTFEFSEFREVAEGLREWLATDMANFSRLGDGAMFRIVRETAFNRHGDKPDFRAIKLKDMIPPLDEIVTNLSCMVDLLTASDMIGDQMGSLVRALENRLRHLNGVFETLAVFLTKLVTTLVNLPSVHAVWIDIEPGGIPAFADRLMTAKNRPPFGRGSFLVGGGIFTTKPAVYNILESLFFTDDFVSPFQPLHFFKPRYGLPGDDDPESVVSKSDWATWLAQPGRAEITMSEDAMGAMNLQSTQDATARGVASFGVEDTGDSSGRSASKGSSGSGRRSGRRTQSGVPSDDLGIGAQVGIMLHQRSSWGTYQVELTRLLMGHDTLSGRAVMSNQGQRVFYLAHVSHDVPRMEQFFDPADPLPSGLLIEGAGENQFLYSDSFSAATLTDSTLTSIPHSAPSADLLRRLVEAGPTVELSSPAGITPVKALQLRATPDHSGCMITNIVDPDGSSTDLSGVIVGDWVVGRQPVVSGEYASFFAVQVEELDPLGKYLWVSPAILTQPVAKMLLIKDMVILGEINSGYLEQANVLFDEGDLASCSVFARSTQWEEDRKGTSIQYLVDSKGPAYAAQVDLSLAILHTLVKPGGESSFPFTDGVLTASPLGTNIDVGMIVELQTSSGACWQFFVLSSTEGAQLEITLRPATGDTPIYDGDPVIGAKVLNPEGTYQGYRRLSLEVPRRHIERTARIPELGSDGYLTLSHSEAVDLEGWVVTPDDVLIPIAYDAALEGESFRQVSVGTIRPGRACIEISEAIKTKYPRRMFQVTYTTSQTTGTLRIYPWMVMPEGGSTWATSGGSARLWHAQWEIGGISSPIPTDGVPRSRAADIVSYIGGKAAIPGSGEALVSCTFYPSNRSSILTDGEELILLYGTSFFILSIVGASSLARLQMVVGGSLYQSSAFDYVRDSKLEVSVDFAYGETDMHFVIVVDGVTLLDEVITGATIPVIDSLILPSAKIYVGSDGQGGNACFGRISGLIVEDSIP